MPIFTFKCRCGEFDDLAPLDAKTADCPKCGKAAKRLFSPTENIHIPAYMSALGSGSSERQAVYLKSERHRKNRAKQEMDVEKAIQREDRIKSNRARLSHTIEARVADNAKYSDQSAPAVAKRAKEYRATGFAK